MVGQSGSAIAPTLVALYNAPYQNRPGVIRFGAPILLSGRILPADATGTLTFSVDGVPAQTVTLSQQTPADYIALGDSITYNGYIGDPMQRYPYATGSAFNFTTTDLGSNGFAACDVIPNEVFLVNLGNPPVSSPLYTVLIGTNDLALFGTGAHEAVFDLCHQGLLTWLGVARTNKLLIGDPGVSVVNGSWTTSFAPNTCCVGLLTNANGSGTVRFTATQSGNVAYLWYVIQIGSSGAFTVSIDGGPASAPIQTEAATTGANPQPSYALLRLPAAPGAHTFDIAAQSGTVTLLGMGLPAGAGLPSPPTVLAGDVPNQQNGNTAGIAQYTADIQSNIATLQADGLDIRFVPTQQYMFATPAEMYDQKHPNAAGLAEIAQAFESAITPQKPSANTTAVAAAGFSTNSLSIGNHTVAIAYSGDAKYAPANASLNLSIYDGTSTTAVSAGAAVYPVQTPITLTASVPQYQASGYVNFFDTTPSGTTALGSAELNGDSPAIALFTVPSLTAGAHSISASFAGDAIYNGSSSQPIAIAVSGSGTATALSASATRYFAESPVALTATVSPSSATGTVAFLDGANLLGQAGLVSGAASFSTSSLAPGIHALTAEFSGSSTQDSSASPVLSVEIDQDSTTTALAPLPSSSQYGTNLTIAATVSPSAATGSVTFSDSFVALGQTAATARTLGQPALSGGTATLNTASLAPGSHTIAALYGGDVNDLTSVSAPAVTLVSQAPSTTNLASIPASVVYGTAIALSASVSPSVSASGATGTVTFADSLAGTLAQVALVNGTASFSVSTLAPGSHSLTATYSGDTFRTGSSGPPLGTAVTPLVSSIVLSALPPTSDIGSPLSLSASVMPSSATGTVIFRDATLGVLGQAAVSHGVATLTLPSPALGSYSIAASYGGDTFDTASTSAAVATQIVLIPTSATLTASAAAAGVGAPVTLTAAISPAGATGIVSFFDGNSTSIGTALIASGSAALVASSLAPGTHTLHATYSGDTLHAGSTTATLAETIALSATSTALTLTQNSVVAGSQATFNVRIATAYTVPTGTVTIRSGTNVLASAALANASAGAGYATLSINSATLGVGTFAVAAYYSGDAENQASDSSAAPVSLTVLSIPTAARLTLSAANVPVQGSVTLTASVSAASMPTGSVTFFNNGASIATVPLNSSGAASTTLSSVPIGVYTLTATYTPTGLFSTASFAAQTLNVTPPLSLALSPSSIDAVAGSTGTATLLVTPLSGFTGSIQTVCQTTVAFVTCSVNAPASIASTNPFALQVQIVVAANDAALSRPLPHAIAARYAVLALLLPLATRRRRRRALRLLTLVLGLAVISLYAAGCSQGGDFLDKPGPQTVAVTVTGAGTAATATMTVNVSD